MPMNQLQVATPQALLRQQALGAPPPPLVQDASQAPRPDLLMLTCGEAHTTRVQPEHPQVDPNSQAPPQAQPPQNPQNSAVQPIQGMQPTQQLQPGQKKVTKPSMLEVTQMIQQKVAAGAGASVAGAAVAGGQQPGQGPQVRPGQTQKRRVGSL